jgi:ABC-type nitrate/sulfonate/bicarbonate transport system permease component
MLQAPHAARRIVPYLYAAAAIVAVWELVVVTTRPDVSLLPPPWDKESSGGLLKE